MHEVDAFNDGSMLDEKWTFNLGNEICVHICLICVDDFSTAELNCTCFCACLMPNRLCICLLQEFHTRLSAYLPNCLPACLSNCLTPCLSACLLWYLLTITDESVTNVFPRIEAFLTLGLWYSLVHGLMWHRGPSDVCCTLGSPPLVFRALVLLVLTA